MVLLAEVGAAVEVDCKVEQSYERVDLFGVLRCQSRGRSEIL